jgi:WD40 repeat protein
MAFSPNSQLLATGSWDNYVRIIEIATGAVKYAIEHGDSVNSVAFSPNGQYLATGSDNNYARIIEIATRVVKHGIKHDRRVNSVAFSPNGQYLATGSDDKNAHIHACLTDNFKNAILASYLKSCQENAMQPNMQEWISEAIQNHRCQKALKNAFPGLAIPGAE